MVVLSFSEPKHYDKLVKREKTQTIRPRNPKRIEQMKRLGIQIYWKQRTPQREKLYDAEYLLSKQITFLRNHNEDKYELAFHHVGGWYNFTPEAKEEIARKDGFDNFEEMTQWFKNRYDEIWGKEFDLIRWNEVK